MRHELNCFHHFAWWKYYYNNTTNISVCDFTIRLIMLIPRDDITFLSFYFSINIFNNMYLKCTQLCVFRYTDECFVDCLQVPSTNRRFWNIYQYCTQNALCAYYIYSQYNTRTICVDVHIFRDKTIQYYRLHFNVECNYFFTKRWYYDISYIDWFIDVNNLPTGQNNE